jgi:hypothetical protein
MQPGLSYVGVNCSAIYEVSNNGGKYGRRRSTLNTGCKPRKGGVLSSKFVMIPSHYARIITVLGVFLKLFPGCGISSNTLLIYFLDVFICVYAENNRKR